MIEAAVLEQGELDRMLDAAGYGGDGAIAVAVVNPDGGIVRGARGTLADGRPMATTTHVYGASLTKQFVAAAIARQVLAGTMDPDRPIGGWIPEYPAWADRITARHLLHHVSRMPTEEPLNARMEELGRAYRSSDNMIAAMASMPELTNAPGDVHAYSNIGYVTLGRIVERVTGVGLAAHFAGVFYDPLGMSSTLLWQGPDRHPSGANPLAPDKPTPHSLGDGGMWTTAEDLTRWIKAMNADAFGVRELMRSKIALNDGTPLDYAWGVNVTATNGVDVFAHGGGWWGSISQMAWIPETQSGFIAFTVDGGEPLEQVVVALRDRLTHP